MGLFLLVAVKRNFQDIQEQNKNFIQHRELRPRGRGYKTGGISFFFFAPKSEVNLAKSSLVHGKEMEDTMLE